MIWNLLMTLLVAAIITGLTHSSYRRLSQWLRGREAAASTLMVLAVFTLLVVPVSIFLGVVAGQAIEVSQAVGPRVTELLVEPTALDDLFDKVPFGENIRPYKAEVLTRIGAAAQGIGQFLINSLASATAGTAMFLFHLFVMLYAMFFFMKYGPALLDKIKYYAPLPREQENLLVDKFVSVSRATLKGTLIIGVVQGGLAGLAFAVVGIEGATFWGTIMAVLSIIPAVGTGLVWVPAVIYLLATGQTAAGIGLAIWCAIVVGTADNFLRPWLVGRDTQMPDLLVLVGTLGGLSLFGAIGIIIGPIIAALFTTVWELYGEAYKDVLAEEA
jgi:predicted PurR-regulated permease PerM